MIYALVLITAYMTNWSGSENYSEVRTEKTITLAEYQALKDCIDTQSNLQAHASHNAYYACLPIKKK